ncbi:MAG: hypothetical protein QG656_2474, partial [Candidatus Hydrogenedentes bacterium]|nr:hypothetical protein [Candidatus Hydrogenedentota bacterium]
MVRVCVLCTVLWCSALCWAEESALAIRNSGFEAVSAGDSFAEAWWADIGGGADASVAVDGAARHSGERSVRIVNRSPLQAFVYASFWQGGIPVEPETTYRIDCFAKGEEARRCFVSAAFDSGGERRTYLASGTFDWRTFSCRFTTPAACKSVTIRFACDDVTESIWFDDISIVKTTDQWVRIEERREPKGFEGVFPRSSGPVAEHLVVYDCSNEPEPMERLLLGLQGIVNRKQPRIYLLNKTNPPGYDEMWLDYMQEKGYTGAEDRIATANELIARFRGEIAGVVVSDPELPGSVTAACMAAGVENALPATPELAESLGLPVVLDLQGRWTRNVDAYQFIRDTYWDRMNHHVLAWMPPNMTHNAIRDYLAEFNVFCFWNSSYSDTGIGNDPAAEEAFTDRLLAETPANIPVLGWPAYADTQGISEYDGVRWVSEFAKFVPGTEFCSNLSVHTAIRPPDNTFRQRFRETRRPIALEKDKVYISVNVLDSGDNLWYWQFHQYKIWSDPARGSVPVGWCMNVTLCDALPLVAQWYYEHATANDSFFAGVSGLGYMNTQVYASRFRTEDRERIWKDYIGLTDAYCRKLDIDGVELYNGSWGETTPPAPDTFARFAEGMTDLDFILADLGRHESITPANANGAIDDTAVFHTLTR